MFFRTDVEHIFWKSVLRFLWFWFFFKKRWIVLSFLLFKFFFKNTFLKKSILNKLRMYISHSFICVLGMCSVVFTFTRLNFFCDFFLTAARTPPEDFESVNHNVAAERRHREVLRTQKRRPHTDVRPECLSIVRKRRSVKKKWQQPFF